MAVGHERINDPNPNPNPNILFIKVLKQYKDHDKALSLLEAIAAQFRPITKSWGFGVTSLQEHEWNPTFAGRNWNGGELIELVLRRRDGSFLPYQYILFVMCHELAHIKEMNHSHDFKKHNVQIRKELAALRAKGYYGDGFWSKGRSLTLAKDEVPLPEEEMPNFTCGGANKKRNYRRRVPKDPNNPTASTSSTSKAIRGAAKVGLHTGRQTEVKRKAGGRVNRAGAFMGEGRKLDEGPEGSTFRKQAGSRSAAEKRADALEKRIEEAKKVKAKEEKDDDDDEKFFVVGGKASGSGSGSGGAKKRKEEGKEKGKGKKKDEVIVISSDEDEEEDEEDDQDGAFPNGYRSGSAGGKEIELSDEEDERGGVELYSEDEMEWMKEDQRGWRGVDVGAGVGGEDGEEEEEDELEDIDEWMKKFEEDQKKKGGVKGKGKEASSNGKGKGKGKEKAAPKTTSKSNSKRHRDSDSHSSDGDSEAEPDNLFDAKAKKKSTKRVHT